MTENVKGRTQLMTTQEVCALLDLPLSTLYGLTKQGTIRGVKVGKQWRYRRVDIERLIIDQGPAKASAVKRHRRVLGNAERRMNPHRTCRLDAKLQTLDDRTLTRTKFGSVRDLSPNGALLTVPMEVSGLRIGEGVNVTFRIPGLKQGLVDVRGMVIHVVDRLDDDESRIGIRFDGLNERAEHAIRAYLDADAQAHPGGGVI